MNKEIEEQIERKKRYIADYIEQAPKIGIPQETIDKTVDLLLKDLSTLMKKRND